MTAKNKSGLPSGVSAVSNRPGLYRLSCMIRGKRYSEYYRPADESIGKKRLQSELQQAIDEFRQKAERGSLQGAITDKSRFSDAVQWYLNTAKLNLRESTLILAERTFGVYITPTLGRYPLKEITPSVITQLLSDLLEKGGVSTLYVARPAFSANVREYKVQETASGAGIGANTLLRVRAGKTVDELTAVKISGYFNTNINTAFEKRKTVKPLKPITVNRISTSLSGFFTACVKNDIIIRNPCQAATKPRVGEPERGAYLDSETLPIFLSALDGVNNDNVRVALTLCLHLGLRSGEARALKWGDVDFVNRILSINHSTTETAHGGLALSEPKTKRSIRKLPLSAYLVAVLNEHQEKQAQQAAALGSVWTHNGLVITNSVGELIGKSPLQLEVKRIVKHNPALPPKLHPHSLRHSFCSLLIANGLDVVNVAALAGDTVEVISKIYAHSFAERRAAAMDMINSAFESALPGST